MSMLVHLSVKQYEQEMRRFIKKALEEKGYEYNRRLNMYRHRSTTDVAVLTKNELRIRSSRGRNYVDEEVNQIMKEAKRLYNEHVKSKIIEASVEAGAVNVIEINGSDDEEVRLIIDL